MEFCLRTGVWGTKKADRYLLDQVRDRLGFPETVMAVKAMLKKWPDGRGQAWVVSLVVELRAHER
jgi:phage terminase large subunit-like protein